MKPVFVLFGFAVFSAYGFTGRLIQPTAAPLHLFRHATDLSTKIETKNSVTDIEVPLFAWNKFVRVKYKDKHNEKVAFSELWGYSDDKGHIYHYSEGLWDEVVAADHGLVIYRHRNKYSSNYYFSKGYDGPLYACRNANLKKYGGDISIYSKEIIDQYF